jgi:hypothetical protein
VSTSAISVRQPSLIVDENGLQQFGLDLEPDVEFDRSDLKSSAKIAFLVGCVDFLISQSAPSSFPSLGEIFNRNRYCDSFLAFILIQQSKEGA